MKIRRISKFVLASCAVLTFGCGEDEKPRVIAGCRVEEARPIGADEAPLGFTARQVVETAAARGGLTFDFGTDRKPGPSVPLEVGIDEAELEKVEWVRESYQVGGDFHPACPPALTFPAAVIVRTSDRQLDERLAVQVWALAADASEWQVEIPIGDVAGSFELEWPLPWNVSALAEETTPRILVFHGELDATTGSWGLAWIFAEFPQGGFHQSQLGSWGERPE